MAANTANLTLMGSHNGFSEYRYDTTDTAVTVQAAGYFNNKDDATNLGKGDLIHMFHWTTAVRTGILNDVGYHVVTNVISQDAASSAGNVNMGGDMFQSGGDLSSTN